MAIPLVEITPEGRIKTIYKDDLDLSKVGKIQDVVRISDIVFNTDSQEWQVCLHDRDDILFSNKSRDVCVDWEIVNFGPGGRFWEEVIK